MFPGSVEFRDLECPAKPCPFGPDICLFSHNPRANGDNQIPLLHSLIKTKPEKDSQQLLATHAEPIIKDSKEPCDRPLLALNPRCKFPWNTRQMALDKIFDALSAESNERAQKALAVELEIYNKAASRQVYTSLLVSTVKTLRLSVEQGGNIAPSSAEDTIPTSALQQLVHSPDVLEKNGYIFQEKNDQSDSPQEPTKVPCDRCLKPFDPKHYYSASGQEEDCRYHLRGKIKQGSSRLYSCCHRPIGELPCQVADKHVYRNLSAPSDFSRIDEWKELPSQRRVVALDAEMIYTTAGTEIARISIVSWDETATLDILVHPEAPVVDYNTRYSGITAQSFSNVENDGISTFHNLRNAVLPKIIGPKTILIGHSLENDLASLKVHPSVFHSSIDNCFKLH